VILVDIKDVEVVVVVGGVEETVGVGEEMAAIIKAVGGIKVEEMAVIRGVINTGEKVKIIVIKIKINLVLLNLKLKLY
jgi:hypothetical protein